MEQIFNSGIYNFGYADIRFKVWQEHRRNGNAMEYRFKWRMFLAYAGTENPNPYASYGYPIRVQLFLNNGNVYTNQATRGGAWDTGEVTTDWYSVANKTSGTTPFRFTVLDVQNPSWLNYSSGTYQLAIDPAGSVIDSVPNFTIGTDFDISTTIYNSSYTNTLKIKFNDDEIATREINQKETTISFNDIELTNIYNATKNSKQPYEFTFELTTMDGESQIGSISTKKAIGTFTNPEPIIEGVGISINSPVLDNGNIIKGVSNVLITITTTPKYNATIKSIKVNGENATVTDSIGNISFTKVTIGTFNVEIEDSRGFITTTTETKNLINYVPITTSASLERTAQTSGEIKITFSGNYWSGNFGGETNDLTCSWKYREKGSNEWLDGTTIIPTIDTENSKYNAYNVSLNTLKGVNDKFFDYQKNYEFLIIATDKISTVQAQYTVNKGIPLFAAYEDNTIVIEGDIDVTGSYYQNGEEFKPGGGDTLPVGTIVEYDGTEIPSGYEDVSSSMPKYKVLWTNSNPRSNYGGGTITIEDTSSYDYLHIIFYQSTNNDALCTYVMQKITNMKQHFAYPSTGEANKLYVREVTIKSNTSIECSNSFLPGIGYYANQLIPYKIIGIKY